MKETRLACMLCDVLGVPRHSSKGKALSRWGEWTDGSETRPRTGCLGDEVKKVISATYTVCLLVLFLFFAELQACPAGQSD